ncbi:2-succinylbenzoate--CoA ligase, chloroplastic/peroxisomal [Cornus florida]|uniref:2-succinylbenzoate--CoA ligase, chloroplastic/peroxisomal n=1 Tax=Cornus florida TaxID=4283 RepID=UPI0028A0653C|nr:2-succinylbenzoate--CoA ligase, chloroplastic/peroxisomal [Cornus florida]
MGSYSQAHICQCLSRLATIRRNSPVTITQNRRKTGQQFVEGVLRLARGLFELGLRNGDVVAISALNSDLYLEWLLAVAFVGGIAAPLNYRWSLKEARLAMEVVQPIMLVTDTGCNYWHSEFQTDSVPSLRWHVLMDSPIDSGSMGNVLTTETLKKPSLSYLSFNYSRAPEGTAMICFTSGTTGKPKGVTISHSALIVQSLAKIAVVGYSEDDVYLHTAPLCHIGGISSAMAMLMAGGCHVLIPKFEAKSAIETIEQHHVTSLITVPSIMADLISLIRTKEAWKGIKSVKKILNGGGGLSVELIKYATRTFPRAKLLSAYGMTETCSSLTFMTLYDSTTVNPGQPFQVTGETSSNSVHQPDGICVGKPAPHVELRIRLQDSSHVGRILTRGPHVMLGYWGQIPSGASDSGDADWLDTGDMGQIDDYGYLWLIGRTKGRIKSGGENVYPEEVEAIISQHPGVSGVVVVGLPDTRYTEMVVACIQIRDDWKWIDLGSHISAKNIEFCLSSEILQHFCKKKNLTGFKIPKTFVIWKKSFPLTTTGKLIRDQVKREVISHVQYLPSNL